FKVKATTSASCGVTDPTGDSFTWLVDQTAPTVTSFNCPAAPTGNQISISFGSSEASATFICTLDSNSASCTNPVKYTGLSLGAHPATVVAKDLAGNQSAPSVCTFTVTTLSAGARFTNCPSAAVLADHVSLEFTADGSNATFECATSETGPFSSCTS